MKLRFIFAIIFIEINHQNLIRQKLAVCKHQIANMLIHANV